MTIAVRAYANADDVLIAWQPDNWAGDWAGFQLERRNDTTQQITVVANRIPPKAGEGPVQPTGIPSAQSPIRRCIWTDHNAVATDSVSYRVTAMKDAGNGSFTPDPSSASAWTEPLVTSGDAGGGLEAYFNRGTLMSQVVSRFVKGDVTPKSLRQFLTNLEDPAFAARHYLAGDALHEILEFLRDADRRGSAIHAAIYEMNDRELVEGLKPFGSRGHVLLGNGGSTKPWVADELTAAGLEVKHRDLSHHGKSSPSVHNKFVVESDAAGTAASRVLTGSTNWTTSGLCTQLNNVLIMEDAGVASRFLDQWGKLVAAGDDMPASLKTSNSTPTSDNNISVYFAATNGEAEFKPVLDLIAGATEGILFLMFMPGQSPLLQALLDRVEKNDIYVRGVVSSVTTSKNGGTIGSVGGQVIKSGAPAQEFHNDVELPAGVSEGDKPSWAETEFNVGEIHGAHLMAIVHSKTIVIDPFSENCAVITGSHNFSDSASTKNDENLVIIRGNTKLAQAYALHINGVYDHYSWRAFLASGGNPDQIYKPLDGWKPGGSRAQELDFWMSEPPSPQAEAQVDQVTPAVRTPPPVAAPKRRARSGATPAPTPAKKARKTAGTSSRGSATSRGGATPRTAGTGTRKKKAAVRATPAKAVKKAKAAPKTASKAVPKTANKTTANKTAKRATPAKAKRKSARGRW
jgi:phosphatidylserine/phosphatidylglycerophosphate/cardiolipin synthase-like enzyme